MSFGYTRVYIHRARGKRKHGAGRKVFIIKPSHVHMEARARVFLSVRREKEYYRKYVGIYGIFATVRVTLNIVEAIAGGIIYGGCGS